MVVEKGYDVNSTPVITKIDGNNIEFIGNQYVGIYSKGDENCNFVFFYGLPLNFLFKTSVIWKYWILKRCFVSPPSLTYKNHNRDKMIFQKKNKISLEWSIFKGKTRILSKMTDLFQRKLKFFQYV